ncbi:protein of unknown function [Georgfuchsia toluolica]|uniref:Hemerythrin-like domain-containing protein n=1 Tax=Georgfuchsia toluolica TaxID=424218 RepID=A0A916J6Y1_9PROT|nr:hemerythrin domain-containing protein [Georgfuchsia toluolica]CAG4885079.1 protein of unknown function [Georgfuchsia toluolica]
MKRCQSLAWLSRQHYAALVLAKHAQRASTDSTEATRQLMAHAVEIFERELEPHFHVEEETLLPLLTAAGETDRVRRTLDEHEELRCLISRLRTGDAASLRRFGDILEAHVRFEERELFAVAESILAPEALAILEMHDLTTGA